MLVNFGQRPSGLQPTAQDLRSQYSALAPALGDHNAMIGTVDPEMEKTLIAQTLANQQPDNTANVVSTGYDLGGIRTLPMGPFPPPSIPMPAMPDWWKDVGTFLQLYPRIMLGIGGGAGLTGTDGTILNSDAVDRPPAGSRPINQTDWSGDHRGIKAAVGALPDDDVRISPTGEVWAQKPDGSWENHGPADSYTGSGNPSGRRGRDRW
jgi:hypothetical protein